MPDVTIPDAVVAAWADALERLAADMRARLVVVPPPPPPVIVDFTATPGVIDAGGQTALAWAVANAAAVLLNGMAVAAEGSQTVSPPATATYTLVAVGADGRTASDSLTVVVNPVEPPPPPPPTDGVVTFNLAESPPYNSVYVGVPGEPFKFSHDEQGNHPAQFWPDADVVAVRGGDWDDPTVWNTGRVPEAGANVAVRHLRFSPDARDQVLRAKTIIGNGADTEVRVGSDDAPNPYGTKKVISLVDGPYEPNDPGRHSRGLLATCRFIVRAEKQPTERAHATGALAAGMATFSVREAVQHWSVGDKVVFADTRRLVSKSSGANNSGLPYEDGFTSATEVRTIAAVGEDGRTFTVDRPLAFDHPAQLDDLGQALIWPVIGHLSRDVVIRSEAPGKHHVLWGHTVVLDAVGLETFNTGVTTAAPLDAENVKGHYAFHAHMAHGERPPALRYSSIWSDVPDNPAKWGLTVHGTHHGTWEHLCVYNFSGWGIGEEGGNEWKNRYTSNFVCGIRTGGPGSPQWTSYGTELGNSDIGRNGNGYWFRGAAQIVRDCEFADCLVGFNLWLHGLGQVQTGPEGDYEPRLLPLDWENFGGGGGRTAFCFEAWHHGMKTEIMVPDGRAAESVLKGFYGYAAWAKIYYNYITNRFTFEDALILNARHGLDGTDYATHNFKVIRLRSYNVDEPLRPSTLGSQVYEDCFFGGADTVLISSLRWGVHEDPPTPRVITYRNCKTRNSKMVIERNGTGGIGSGSVNLRALDRLLVEDFEGVPGDNFEVYTREQHPDWPMPADVPQNTYLIGSPEEGTAGPDWHAHYAALHTPFEIKPGLTNRELLAKYGFCWANKLLPENVTVRPGVVGLVGPLEG